MIEKIKVLDHGYVALIEKWGSDSRIIEAARMSTDKGFLGWGRGSEWTCGKCHYMCGGDEIIKIVREKGVHVNASGTRGCPNDGVMYCPNTDCWDETMVESNIPGDEKLLRYLYEHKHMTPFEMGGLVIEVQAPIFVFREWHRHRTQSYNELSARYTSLPDVNYVPSVERLLMGGGANKQASTIKGATRLDETGAVVFQEALKKSYLEQQILYNLSLNMGVPKELARVMLPVGRYSKMRASTNLRNWLQFLTLRMDAAAQYEIRQYANIVGTLIEQHFPRTWALFNEHRVA